MAGARWNEAKGTFADPIVPSEDASGPTGPDLEPQREQAAGPASDFDAMATVHPPRAFEAPQPGPEVQGAPVLATPAEADDLGKSSMPAQGACGDSSPTTLARQEPDPSSV